jgi:hypothetical protein
MLVCLAFFVLFMGWKAFDPNWSAGHSGQGVRGRGLIKLVLNNSPWWLRGTVLTSVGALSAWLGGVMLKILVLRLPIARLDQLGIAFYQFPLSYSAKWSELTAISALGDAFSSGVELEFDYKHSLKHVFFGKPRLVLRPPFQGFDTETLFEFLGEKRPDLCHHLREEAQSSGLIKPKPLQKPSAPAIIVDSGRWTG